MRWVAGAVTYDDLTCTHGGLSSVRKVVMYALNISLCKNYHDTFFFLGAQDYGAKYRRVVNAGVWKNWQSRLDALTQLEGGAVAARTNQRPWLRGNKYLMVWQITRISDRGVTISTESQGIVPLLKQPPEQKAHLPAAGTCQP